MRSCWGVTFSESEQFCSLERNTGKILERRKNIEIWDKDLFWLLSFARSGFTLLTKYPGRTWFCPKNQDLPWWRSSSMSRKREVLWSTATLLGLKPGHCSKEGDTLEVENIWKGKEQEKRSRREVDAPGTDFHIFSFQMLGNGRTTMGIGMAQHCGGYVAVQMLGN